MATSPAAGPQPEGGANLGEIIYLFTSNLAAALPLAVFIVFILVIAAMQAQSQKSVKRFYEAVLAEERKRTVFFERQAQSSVELRATLERIAAALEKR